jgi:hypothetical protein
MRLVQMKPVQGLFLGEGLEAVKNGPHGHWGRNPIDAPANGSPLQRTPCAAAGTTAPPSP